MSNHSAHHKFLSRIKKTEVVDYLLKSLDQEPVRLLGVVCRAYEKMGQPVPDHQIHPSGYVGEIAIKALVGAGLLKMLPGQRQALFLYEPTEEGLKVFKELDKEGVYASAKPV